jgi:hypothetical protein
VLVFQNAHLDAELHGNSRLAFADPLGVGLEDGEDFLCVDFTANHATLNLIDLAPWAMKRSFVIRLPNDGGQCLADFVEVALPHSDTFGGLG